MGYVNHIPRRAANRLVKSGGMITAQVAFAFEGALTVGIDGLDSASYGYIPSSHGTLTPDGAVEALEMRQDNRLFRVKLAGGVKWNNADSVDLSLSSLSANPYRLTWNAANSQYEGQLEVMDILNLQGMRDRTYRLTARAIV